MQYRKNPYKNPYILYELIAYCLEGVQRWQKIKTPFVINCWKIPPILRVVVVVWQHLYSIQTKIIKDTLKVIEIL